MSPKRLANQRDTTSDKVRRRSRIFPRRNRDETTRILQKVRSGQHIGPYETEGVRKDGAGVQLSVTVSPILNPTGQAIAASAIARDITEHKRTEQILMDADRRKDEFLAILGHELRNPLTPIRHAVDVLSRQDDLPEKARWAADMIGRQSEQLERLVNDLLDVSRITRGEIQLRKQAVIVQDPLADALQNVAQLLE
ncbi:MAG: PAS domain S-box protein [Chromatiaceae bacterium]|nr:PAS domain S-box protein [Chromatiaceae bacterium]